MKTKFYLPRSKFMRSKKRVADSLKLDCNRSFINAFSGDDFIENIDAKTTGPWTIEWTGRSPNYAHVYLTSARDLLWLKLQY